MKKKKEVVYDICSIPENKTLDEVISIYHRTSFIIWQSLDSNGRLRRCFPPKVLEIKNDDSFIIDISIEAGKELYNKINQ